MNPSAQHATWVETDLAAIEANAAWFVRHSPARLMAVVKANGYGHGALSVARRARQGGASWFGVARAEEALELRLGGILEPILCLGRVPSAQFEPLIAQAISLTVWEGDQVDCAAAAAQACGKAARLHLKVDTGMGRIGIPPEQAVEMARRITSTPKVALEGVFTHFAKADAKDASWTETQLRSFEDTVASLAAGGLRPSLVHAANSAATLRAPATHLDLVRVGIALYGLRASVYVEQPDGLRPALQWKTQLSMLKTVPPGTGISYNHRYVTTGHERIGTIPVGYGDGFRRTRGNEVLVGGRRVPVVGSVCMDQCMIQLDSVPQVSVGEEVVLLGRQDAAHLTAEEIAERWGTINYEVVCGIGARVPRLAA
jgi:alanine racemase